MADEKETYTKEEYAAMIAERDALKANRDAALDEAKDAKKRLKNYEGVDPEEFKRLKAASEEAERKRAAAEGDFESLKKSMADKHQSELSERDKRIAKRDKAIERRLIEAELTRELVEGGAKKGMLKLLTLEGRQYMRVRETDEDFESYVSDERGNAIIADGKGTPMTLKDLVAQKLKTQYPDAFEGTGSSGSGASRSSVGGGGTESSVATDNSSFLAGVDALAKAG